MTVQKLANILNSVGIQANAGENTIIIRDMDTNVAVCKFDYDGPVTFIKVIRGDLIQQFEFGDEKYTDFEILQLILHIAGGVL